MNIMPQMIHYTNLCMFYSSMTAPSHPPGWILSLLLRTGAVLLSAAAAGIFTVCGSTISPSQMKPNISALNYEEEQGLELMMEGKRQARKRLSNRYF